VGKESGKMAAPLDSPLHGKYNEDVKENFLNMKKLLRKSMKKMYENDIVKKMTKNYVKFINSSD
jgi:hypothetical protein